MHPRIFGEFEKICSKRPIRGSVLEIGAVNSKNSLLCMKSLQHATEKVGINLDGPHEFMDFHILKGNANSMDMFEDERFDLVLCNAMLEHDKHFWKTIAEIKRVVKTGGHVVIGVPGFLFLKWDKWTSVLKRMSFLRRMRADQYLDPFFSATITYQVHDAPGDYYRFSRQAVQEVLLEDYDDVALHTVMLPPRIIGIGTKGPRSHSSA